MLEGTLSAIFHKISNGEVVVQDFFSKADYESARVGLLRRFRKNNEAFEKLGFDGPGVGKFVKCSWNSKTRQGTFQIEDDKRRSHTGKAKVYETKDV